MVHSRVDHNYSPTDSTISPQSLRRWLRLTSIPKHIGHTVNTKTVAKGAHCREEVKQILTDHNSYGPEILDKIMDAMNADAGRLVSTSSSTQGVSDFTAVLSVSLAIIDAHRSGALSLEDVDPSKAMDVIIEALNKNNYNYEAKEVGAEL